MSKCIYCKGTGKINPYKDEMEASCSVCDGTGDDGKKDNQNNIVKQTTTKSTINGEIILNECTCGKEGLEMVTCNTCNPLFIRKEDVCCTCPVCSGKGLVHNGFYNQFGGTTTSIASETCKSCSGNGIVWKS